LEVIGLGDKLLGVFVIVIVLVDGGMMDFVGVLVVVGGYALALVVAHVCVM
jgi:hypothetical protein